MLGCRSDSEQLIRCHQGKAQERSKYAMTREVFPQPTRLTYAAAPRIPLALLVLGAIYKQATPALLILGALAGAMQLLDAGIGLFQHDIRKCAGPLFLAVLQLFVVYLLHISVRIRQPWPSSSLPSRTRPCRFPADVRLGHRLPQTFKLTTQADNVSERMPQR
jgi:hypothetical protein